MNIHVRLDKEPNNISVFYYKNKTDLIVSIFRNKSYKSVWDNSTIKIEELSCLSEFEFAQFCKLLTQIVIIVNKLDKCKDPLIEFEYASATVKID